MPSLTTIDLNKNDNFIDIGESEDFTETIDQNCCSSSSHCHNNNQLKPEDTEELIKAVQSKIALIRTSMNQLAVYVMGFEDTIFRLRHQMDRAARQQKAFEDIHTKLQKNLESAYDQSSEPNDLYFQVPQLIDETSNLVNDRRIESMCKLNRLLSEETIPFLNQTYQDLATATNQFTSHDRNHRSLKTLCQSFQDEYNRINDNQSILEQINSKIQQQQRKRQYLQQSTLKQFSLIKSNLFEQKNKFEGFKYQPQASASNFEEDDEPNHSDFFAPSGQLRSDREVNRRHNIEEEENDGEAEWLDDVDESERLRKKSKLTEEQEKSSYFHYDDSHRSPDISSSNILTQRTRGGSEGRGDLRIMSKVIERRYDVPHEELMQSPYSLRGDDDEIEIADEVDTRKHKRKGDDGDDSDWVDADERKKKKGRSLKTTGRKETVKKPGKSPAPPTITTNNIAPTTRNNGKSAPQVIEIDDDDD